MYVKDCSLSKDEVKGGIKYILSNVNNTTPSSRRKNINIDNINNSNNNNNDEKDKKLTNKEIEYSEMGNIRIKIRYTEEIILSIKEYIKSEIIDILIKDEEYTIVRLIGKTSNERERIANLFIKIYHYYDKAIELVNYLTTKEITETNNCDIIFRGNSIATKTLDVYMKFVGMNYLKNTLQKHIRQLFASKDVCEINPSKLEKGEDPKKNISKLKKWVKKLFKDIIKSVNECPHQLRLVFSHLQSEVKKQYTSEEVKITKYTAVSGFIFLRFFCPAILGPKLFNIMDNHPDVNTNRSLILIAKTLQNLANLVEFGGGKEDYMTDMNDFVIPNLDIMKQFIDNIATPSTNTTTNEIHVNIEKELATISRYLRREFEQMNSSAITPMEKQQLEKLGNALHFISDVEQNIENKNV